jgi:hypothetical protein
MPDSPPVVLTINIILTLVAPRLTSSRELLHRIGGLRPCRKEKNENLPIDRRTHP